MPQALSCRGSRIASRYPRIEARSFFKFSETAGGGAVRLLPIGLGVRQLVVEVQGLSRAFPEGTGCRRRYGSCPRPNNRLDQTVRKGVTPCGRFRFDRDAMDETGPDHHRGVLIGVAIGSALHNFVSIDSSVIEEMMRAAGGDNPATDAPGFTSGFRLAGDIYIAANAVGIAALWSRASWLYWWVLAANVTQGLGWVMIPSQMWTVVACRYDFVGVLPSAVTDGGAVLLAIGLIGLLFRYRATWARDRRAI